MPELVGRHEAKHLVELAELHTYVGQKDAAKGRTLATFTWWATHQGQSFGQDLFYAPLPARLVRAVEEQIKKLRFGGATRYRGT